VCRSKHVEPAINFGIINSIIKLHLVGISTEFMLHNFYLRVIGLLDPEDEDTVIYRSNGKSLGMSWNI
jgi:hypothetical protein